MGRLLTAFPQVQSLPFSLTLVTLPSPSILLLLAEWTMTLLNLLGATRCFAHPTAHRHALLEPLLNDLAVDLTPRLVSIVAILEGTSPHRVTILGPT